MHIPVMLEEAMAALMPVPQKTYVDATLGAGGHSQRILEHIMPDGRLLGIDQDPVALRMATERLVPYFIPNTEVFRTAQGNFSQLSNLLPTDMCLVTGGVLADLGVSSMQLDDGSRGFSFNQDAPLDMRMSPETALNAEIVVNTYSEADLIQIFSDYGEEHLSKTVAQAIVQRRKEASFKTTGALANFIAGIYRSRGKHSNIHPATRIFQAIRIEVNDELGSLQRFLEALPDLMAPEARIVLISFHSLEDRLVKQFFQRENQQCICPPRIPICVCKHQARLKILNSKPIQATPEEIRINPRARSAKLRAAKRI